MTSSADGNSLNTSDTRIKFEANDKGIPNAKLIIEQLDYEDRAHYTCEANKLGALWPFLGICAEVFVLCAIIFVYEKKREKLNFNETDIDQNIENKNFPDHREGMEIRQRKAIKKSKKKVFL
ncbi:basigin-like [Tachypleus tridentatus]|uniref:basigin-like n=1 Tax=Tachypleus tridentatus TaxID=6853 RepID=UPI003FCF4889